MSVKELVSFDESVALQASQAFGPAGDSQKEADANMNVSEEFSLAPEVLSNTRVKTISIVDEKVSQESSLHGPGMPLYYPGQEINRNKIKLHEDRSGSDNARAELMNARPDYGRDKRDAM